MKIALIGPSYPFRGGLAHYTTLLYRNLKRNHQVKFLSFKRQYPNFLFPGKTDKDPSQFKIKENAVEYTIDSLNPLSWFFTASEILKFRPKLLIMPWWVSFWAPTFWTISFFTRLFTNIKILFICHNVVSHESNFIDKICTWIVLSQGHYFIVHSQEDLENLRRMFPKCKVKRTFLPTFEIFNFNKIEKEEAQKELCVKGKILLFFGFIRPYKGLMYLLDALPMILKEIDVTLLVAGEFWYDKDRYLNQIDRLGLNDKVKIIDRYIPNEEVGLYFSACDIVILPYVSGTGSWVVQIAFGFDKPVIATKVGCLPEVVNDGKTGYLVTSQNPDAIAETVLQFYSERDRKNFSGNIEEDRKNYSWAKFIEKIENLE